MKYKFIFGAVALCILISSTSLAGENISDVDKILSLLKSIQGRMTSTLNSNEITIVDLKKQNFSLMKEIDLIKTSLSEITTSSILPVGAVLSFNLKRCPDGWLEYEPAYGRFIRGIDKSGTAIDPDGKRPPGAVQGDELKNHNHSYTALSTNRGTRGGFVSLNDSLPPTRNNTESVGGHESRPKNVALLYCIKT